MIKFNYFKSTLQEKAAHLDKDINKENLNKIFLYLKMEGQLEHAYRYWMRCHIMIPPEMNVDPWMASYLNLLTGWSEKSFAPIEGSREELDKRIQELIPYTISLHNRAKRGELKD